MHARLWIALAVALVSGSFAGQASANDDLPVKIDFVWRFKVHVGPNVMVPENLPPWYLWFPYDPNMNLSPQASTTPFPHWPTQFPPAQPSAEAASRMTYYPAARPSPYMPVAYPPPPSYWYPR